MMKIVCIALLAIALRQAEAVPKGAVGYEDPMPVEDVSHLETLVESDSELAARIKELKEHAAERLESIKSQAQQSISQIAKQYHAMAGDAASTRQLIEEQIKSGAEKFRDALNELSTKAEALYSRLIRETISADSVPTSEDSTSEMEKDS